MVILKKIQEEHPLVLNLANSVTQQYVANVISYIGGSPLMTTAIEDVEELLSISNSLVLNTGTINEKELPLFIEAGRKANELGKPVVLDPVAVMLPYRASVISRLIKEVKFTVIRGNAAEIAWFAQSKIASKGIDAIEDNTNSKNAIIASQITGAVIVQSGQVDIITDGKSVLTVDTHSSFFKVNVGAGDMLSATIATFLAATTNSLQGAYEATILFGKAGERASQLVNNLPGDFIPKVLDVLYQFAQEQVREN
ncbi:hydroxyethylthiazole kinase [Lactovum miscens]|uniref:Hydroxyethylthiazole kinase n=1 Tax=Lactovum miscens TaxID=190387 RepID=A0A841CB23_9LACT|nr:hydroxyethylthiazole kinase [Lactovum miscens]MBB5888751.1 hydroxyethylthiazole kinase [Lactovum miscens]